MQREVDHMLLARYAPPCVVIDENLEVVQFRGRTGSYLEAAPGQPQLNVLKMAREGLASQLPLAIQRARQSDAPVRQDDVIVHERGHEQQIHLELVVKLVSVDPSPIVEAAVEAARPAADTKRIAIETTLATGPKIVADPRRLRQIASNLLGNAIKFTAEGGTVTVALDRDRGAMELRVCDTGPGIPPEFLSRVFEAFSQADPSLTRTHNGLGIGLALVRHFVVRQGGTIEVASPGAGQGTTFTVRIPAHVA